MKALVKKISKWSLALVLSLSLTGLSAQYAYGPDDPDPVIIVQKKIIKLEDQLTSLRMLSKRDMTQSEKRAYRKEKRAVRRALNQQRELLARMTSPWPHHGYYGPVWAGPYYRPIWRAPRPRVVIVNPPRRRVAPVPQQRVSRVSPKVKRTINP
jgi:hypothetical protein